MKFKILPLRLFFLSLLAFVSTNAFSQCFEIQSILVDACGGTDEGRNEMVRFKVGNSSLNVNFLTAVWPNNSWQGVVQNAVTALKVSQLNDDIAAAGGCGQILEPPGGILPPDATAILVTSFNMSPIANSFGPLSENIYMIFQNNANNSVGHFANFGPAPGARTFSMTFVGSCSDTVVYDRTLLTDTNGNNVAADGATVNFTPSGVASYSNSGCKAPIPPFTIDAGPLNLTACAGTTITLNGAALGQQSVIWSSASGSFSSATSIITDYIVPLASGGTTLLLTLEATNSCGFKISDAINLSVTTSVTPDFVTALTLCTTDIAPILATTSPNGITGTWNPAIINSSVNGNYLFTPNTGQCATTSTLSVTITPEIIPDFDTSLTLCTTDIAPILASTSPNGITGTWNPAIINSSVNGNYIFTPNTGQCATTSTLSVNITPEIIPDFDTSLTLCTTDIAPILASTSPNGITGTWNPTAINSSVNGNYIFTPNTGQCATTSTLSVTITPEIIPDFDTSLTLCTTDIAPILSTTSPNGIKGTWNPAIINSSVNGNYIFTPNTGQCATTSTLSVTITPEIIPDFDTSLTLCTTDIEPILASTSPNGIKGTWNPAIINSSVNGNYIFTPNTGQCATTSTLAVTITPEIIPDFDTSLTLCKTDLAPILASTSPNGITGTWNPTAINSSVNGNYIFTPNTGQCATTSTLSVTITPAIIPDFDTSFTLCTTDITPILASTSPNGITGTWNPAIINSSVNGNYIFTPNTRQCATTSTLSVTITPEIIPDFDTSLTLCSGNSAPILASISPNGITGTWNPAIINSSVNGNYIFTPNTGQCATTSILTVNISFFKYSVIQECIDNNYFIKVVPDSDFKTSDFNYSWIDDNGNQIGYNDAIFNFTEYSDRLNNKPLLPLQFKVIVSLESCEIEQVFQIADNLCGVPNVVSPNDDGINDNFNLSTFNVNNLKIFNRYGTEVYNFQGKYENQWYGQWRNGKLPTGTYFYIISTQNGESKAGWVFLSY